MASESWSEDGSYIKSEEPDNSRKHKKGSSNNNASVQDKSRKGPNQDRDKPFYVPRKPHFFEHDLRILDEDDVEDYNKKYMKREEDHDCWTHDLFDSDLQKPKSKQEIVDCYGYDIRSDSPTTVDENFRGRRFCLQQDARNNGFKAKQRTDDLIERPSPPSFQRQNEYPSLPAKCESERKVKNENVTILKSRENDIQAKSILIKSKPIFTDYRDPEHQPLRTFKKESDTLSSSSSSASSVHPSLKNSNRPSGAISSKFSRNGQANLVANCVNSSNNVPLVKPQRVRGRGLNININMSKGPENHPASITARNIPKENCIAKMTDCSKNIKSSIALSTNKSSSTPKTAPPKRQNVVNVRAIVNSEDTVASPSRVLNTDTKIPQSNAAINSCTGVTLPPDCCSYSNYLYGINSNENFIFPEPPDVSASHLTPYFPQHQYYFTNTQPNPYFYQGYEPPMHWGYYTQAGCYQGTPSGITYIKQQCLNSWPNSPQVGNLNQLVSSSQVDASPYYCVQHEAEVKLEEHEVDEVSACTEQLTVSSQMLHRYSLVRSKLHSIISKRSK